MSGGLPTRQVEKPWGRDFLPMPFIAQPGKRIGEIWFEPPVELPELLVKYIFTSELLSVQVHPNDEQAQAAGPGRQGKEECWLILDAEPGARLGIGFAESLDADAMRAASLDGSIEQLMQWHSARPGDFFYIPAGTVHAIGGGVSLIEIQQNSDVTYRLYDYGRPRELHLESAVVVAKGEPYDAKWQKRVPPRGNAALVDGPLFRLDQVYGAPRDDVLARHDGKLLVIPREGPVHIAGQEVAAGQCGFARSLDEVEFAASGVSLLASPCSY